MDLLVKQKIYVWVIIALILLNLSVLLLIWLDSPKPPAQSQRTKMLPVGDFFSKELELTQEQKKLFEEARIAHFNVIDSVMKEIDAKRTRINTEIFKKNADDKTVDQVADSIGMLTAKTEKLRIEHFAKLYSFLNEKQAEKFKKMINETMRPGLSRMMRSKDAGRNPGMRPNGPMPEPGPGPGGSGRPDGREMPPPPNGVGPHPNN